MARWVILRLRHDRVNQLRFRLVVDDGLRFGPRGDAKLRPVHNVGHEVMRSVHRVEARLDMVLAQGLCSQLSS